MNFNQCMDFVGDGDDDDDDVGGGGVLPDDVAHVMDPRERKEAPIPSMYRKKVKIEKSLVTLDSTQHCPCSFYFVSDVCFCTQFSNTHTHTCLCRYAYVM